MLHSPLRCPSLSETHSHSSCMGRHKVPSSTQDHLSCWLSVRGSPTCREGQSAWALALPCFARYSHHAERVLLTFLRRLLQLGMKGACTCCWKKWHVSFTLKAKLEHCCAGFVEFDVLLTRSTGGSVCFQLFGRREVKCHRRRHGWLRSWFSLHPVRFV